MIENNIGCYMSALRRQPNAMALIRGKGEYCDIKGTVRFYQLRSGVLTALEISGLPTLCDKCKSPVFGFHIHEGECCTGNAGDPYADTGAHFDMCENMHPYHSGDMPPIFSSCGFGFMIFLTDRFCVRDIVGRTVVVHAHPDDFHTQPSGSSGEKIACGEILASC